MSTVDLYVHSEIRTVPSYWERVRIISIVCFSGPLATI